MQHNLFLNKKQLRRHAFVWILVIIFFNLYSYLPGSLEAKIIGNIIEDLNYIFVFYTLSLLAFPIFWKSKYSILLVVCIILSYSFFSSVTYIDYYIIIPHLKGITAYSYYPVSVLFVDDIFYFMCFGLAGAASFLYHLNLYNYEKQAEKEKSILITDLNFLKNQFNSHISFNFINFCYSKTHLKLPEFAKSIELYSDLIRTTLQSKTDETFSISKEISKMNDYIRLQKLIFKNDFIRFNYEIKNDCMPVLGNIFIFILENICNNLIMHDPNHAIIVQLKSNANSHRFKICCEKSLISDYTDKSEKIVKNICQILNYYYPSNYNLMIVETEIFISIELECKVSAI